MSVKDPLYRLFQIEKHPVETLEPLSRQGGLFALVDACDAPEVPVMCQSLGESHAVSLYSGDAATTYSDIAPYLVHVDSEEVLDWLRQHLWETPWGIFVLSPGSNLNALRRHFRQFLMVQDPDGEEMYFRFYDPRVLPSFLPTCLPAEVRVLFGPVTAFGMVGEDGAEVYWWRERRPEESRPR